MKVEVTQNDIDIGLPRSATSCPVARACNRAGFYGATVGVTRLLYFDGHQTVGIDMPSQVTNFIKAFDAGRRRVEPFVFELDDIVREGL